MIADCLSALLAANLAAGAGVLLVMALRHPVRRLLGAGAAYTLWLIPLVAAAAIFLPTLPARLPIPTPAPFQATAQAAIDAASTQMPLVVQTGNDVTQYMLGPAVLLAIWLAGALAALLLTAQRQQRSLRRFGPIGPADSEGVRRAAQPGVGPAIVGVLRPRLVLSIDFEDQFDAKERTLILAHERRHIAAGDTRINALVAALACLNWFNPLVHLAARTIRRDQELACDAAVIATHPNARRAYGEALLKTQINAAALPLGCYWPMRSHKLLKERITMLAAATPSRRLRLTSAGLVSLRAPASTPKPPVNVTVTCDTWFHSGYSNDPQFGDWKRFNSKAKLVAHFDETGTPSVSLPDDAFPAGIFPVHDASEGHLNTYSGEAIAYRLMSKELIDTVNFTGVDRDHPKVAWERIRLSAEGPKDTRVEGACHK